MRLSSPPKSFKFQRHNSSIRPAIGFNIFLTASARSSIIFWSRRVSIVRDMKTVGARIGHDDATCRMLCFVTRRLQFFGALDPRGTRSKVSLAVTIIPAIVNGIVAARYRRPLSTKIDSMTLCLHF